MDALTDENIQMFKQIGAIHCIFVINDLIMRIRKTGFESEITEEDQQISKVANALAHPLRVALVRYLKEKNCGEGVENITCNKDLVEMFDYSQSTISQHIKILKECGLFTVKTKNKFCYYYLNRELLNDFSKNLKV